MDLHPQLKVEDKQPVASTAAASAAASQQKTPGYASFFQEGSTRDPSLRGRLDRELAVKFLITPGIGDSLSKKSAKHDVAEEVLRAVYRRGLACWDDENKTPEQYAFDRVNSFVSGGRAVYIDDDLAEHAGFTGTPELVRHYAEMTPGQSSADLLKRVKRIIR